MLSVTSLFNASLMRRNFRRFWPLWALYTVIWTVMMPVAMGLNLRLYTRFEQVIGSNATDMVLDYSAQIQVVLNGCIGVLLAMALFSYLNTPRSVGMMHSLPISRKSLFVTNFLSGLVMLLSTYLAVFLMTGMVEIAFGVLNLKELLQWLWVCCGTGFFCYAFGVLCAVFAGQVLAVPVFYVILNFVAIGMYYLLDSFAAVFRFGAGGQVLFVEEQVAWLSPLSRLMNDMGVRHEYIEETERHIAYLEGQATVAVYIAVGIVITFFAFGAYLRRKSESAGDIVAVSWAKPVFKYGVAFCAAFTVGVGMYAFFIKTFLPGYSNSIPGALVCLVIAGVVGYYVAEMLVQKSFKVIRKGGKGALAAMAGILVIGLVMTLDITGFDTYMPQRDEIMGVRVFVNGPDFHVDYVGTDPATVDDTYALHTAIIHNRDTVKERSRHWSYGEREDMNYCYVNIEYLCGADGDIFSETVERRYEVYCLDEEPSVPGTVGFAMADLLSSEAVIYETLLSHSREKVLQVLGGRFSYLDVNNDFAWNEKELSQAQAQAVYEALVRDVESVSVRRADHFDDITVRPYQNKECSLEFYCLSDSGETVTHYINLGSYAENAFAALYAQGVLPAGTELAEWSDELGEYVTAVYERAG